jgi:hypothetical protein
METFIIAILICAFAVLIFILFYSFNNNHQLKTQNMSTQKKSFEEILKAKFEAEKQKDEKKAALTEKEISSKKDEASFQMIVELRKVKKDKEAAQAVYENAVSTGAGIAAAALAVKGYEETLKFYTELYTELFGDTTPGL